MNFPAIFAIVVGVGMIGQWVVSYFSKQIPELQTEPIRILFHLTAELTTALTLIVSGVGLLGGWTWGVPTYLVATGMLLYTAIVSPGYFAQKGQWGWLVMFGVIILLALVNLSLVI